MKVPCRYKVQACIHAETYKYYVEGDRVQEVWARLENRYGPSRKNDLFGIIELYCERFIFKAVLGGNPITVIRRHLCTESDVAELHRLIGFNEQVHPSL